jgi:uncharacterized glyoxalase superfamily protein PhnB
MAHLYRVILPVNNIERAAAFYGAVFDTPGQRVSPGRHYFHCDGTILACYDSQADGDGDQGTPRYQAFQYLYFAVDDLEATFQRVRDAGATIDAAIESKPWGERIFYARDPFGSPISFVDASTVFTGT